MTKLSQKAPLYPKGHLLAASGVAAILSLVLLIFPSREVEAKRSLLDYNFDASAQSTDMHALEQDLREAVETESLLDESEEAPFPVLPLSAGVQAAPSSQKNAALHESSQTKKLVVANGDTLSTLMARAGQPAALVHELLESSKEARQLTQLQAGQVLELRLSKAGDFQQVRTQLSELESLVLEKTAKGYQVKTETLKPETGSAYAFGVIDSSLVSSAKEAGLSYALTMDLANIFAYDIDFALDIQKGDSFEVLYEEKTLNGKSLGVGHILAARFTNQGKTYTAVRYKTRSGAEEYYTAQGDSMRKAFIRTPVDVARISSGFSVGRRHPILNKIRAHKGVDYAAPPGTPIKSAGNGTVIEAGRSGGYGNTVVVQHGKRYRTLYAHMQGFAKGVREGAAVKQGQIIGYIGTTGLSTGPHLHYEFQVDGQHVDPLSQKLPMSNPIVANEKSRFLQLSRAVLARMDQEKSTQLASNKP